MSEQSEFIIFSEMSKINKKYFHEENFIFLLNILLLSALFLFFVI